VVSTSVSEDVLGNGLPLVEMPVSGRLAAAVAVLFPAGARHEREDEVGAAHLLEHLVFKGTENHRTANGLNRAAEYLGTELDGASTTDYVEFSTIVRAESAMPAVDLLTEVVATPLLRAADLELERAVILREIADDNEDPGSRADDLLLASLFAGHRLATNVAGDVSDVEKLTRDRVLAFRDRQWATAAGLAVIAGNLDHLNRDRLRDVLGSISQREPPAPAPPIPAFAPRVGLEQRDGEVVHLRLAYQVPGVDFTQRRDRAVAEVVSQVIGGPMGSRLFDELREQRALCYWVDAYLWAHGSTTFLSVRCSVRPSDLDEAYERIQTILGSLRATGPTDEESRRMCAYAAGAAALEFESVSSRLDHAVELIMEYGDHDVDPALHIRQIEAVTRAELVDLAGKIEPAACVGCVGPATRTQFA
jgi:predicted Zn-dependent peptidase